MEDSEVWNRILRAVARVSERDKSHRHHGRPRSEPEPEPEPVRPIKSLAWYVPFNKEPQNAKILGSPQVQWKCPPKFDLNPQWHVTAGEESWETKAQMHRETTVLGVVYPRPSAIPPTPSCPPDTERDPCDNAHIPVLPIIPVEEALAEEESKAQSDSFLPAPATGECSKQLSRPFTPAHTITRTAGNGPICAPRLLTAQTAGVNQVRLLTPSAVRPDDETATTSAIRQQQEPFEKLRADRIKELIHKYGASSASPVDRLVGPPPIDHLHQWWPNSNPPFHSNYMTFPIRQTIETPVHRPLTVGQPVNHAQGLQLGHKSINNKPIETNPKYQKPCRYFNTPNGCRNGSKCLYGHGNVAKRMKSV